MTQRVLLVEDDELIGTLVEVNLQHQGYEVTWARTGEDGLARLGGASFDAILLDLMLPGIDGLEVASRLRRQGVGTPVLMMTVRGETTSKVRALDAGIDDYLTKPFDVEELLARVRALIRRGHAAGEVPASARLAVAGGQLDLDGLRFVDAAGNEHGLTEKEAGLLALLARSAGRTLTRTDILEEVWGMDAVPPERTVDNFILRLRRLIGDDPDQPRHLVTVRGRGYRYDP
jgi:DNA-binding response OmpR family regulator